MKARTSFEKQVAASNVRLTAIDPKVTEWGMKICSTIRLSECRAVLLLVETAVISSDMRERASMSYALTADTD